MNWVEDNNGVNGGYCSCASGETMFSGMYKNNTWYNHKVGASCCPAGTKGYPLNSFDKPAGYGGALAQGEDKASFYEACWCPDNQVYVNNQCQSCPVGSDPNFFGGDAGHLQFPPFTLPPVLLVFVFDGHLQFPSPASPPKKLGSLPTGHD